MPLSDSDYQLFMNTYLPLLYFTGLVHGIIPEKTSFKSFIRTMPKSTKFECRQQLIQDENIVRKFMAKNGAYLSLEERKIIDGLSKRIKGKFIIYKLLTDRAIFLGEENIFYEVYELSDPFDTLVNNMPCVVEASILPFQNRIVYDGFLQPYNVHIGPNMRKDMREHYKKAKEDGRIVKSLK